MLQALAGAGNEQAAQTIRRLYQRVRRHITPLHELVAEHFIILGGPEALRAVLRDEAAAFAREGEANRDILWLAETHIGASETGRVVAQLAEAERAVGEYLEAINQPSAEHAPPKLPRTYDEIWEYIRGGKRGSTYYVMREVKLAEADWAKLEKDLEAEKDPAVQQMIASVFAHQEGTQYGLTQLLKLARAEDIWAAQAAVRALKVMEGPQVRQLGLEFLKGERAEYAVQLLTLSARPDDAENIRAALFRQPDEDGLHSVLFDLPELTENNPIPEFLQLLADSYAYNPCASCRMSAVRTLLNLEALPDWLHTEAMLDATEDMPGVLSLER